MSRAWVITVSLTLGIGTVVDFDPQMFCGSVGESKLPVRAMQRATMAAKRTMKRMKIPGRSDIKAASYQCRRVTAG